MRDIASLGHIFVIAQRKKNAEVTLFLFNYMPGRALLLALHA